MAEADDLAHLDFDIVNKGLLGQGAFAKVYLVENADKEQFALKVMQWTNDDLVNKTVAEKELEALQTLKHDNVVVYIDSFGYQGSICIITEFCAGGDLGRFLEQVKEEGNTAVPEDLLVVWLYQMACGLEYMHTPEEEKAVVLHRDLKPGNILLTDIGDLRLGDVGVARILEEPDALADTFCGTLTYMSPEVLREQPYNFKTDIWSLGCCAGEIATQKQYNPAECNLFGNVTVKSRERLPAQYSQALDNLVGKMLLENVEERITASEILDSDLLQDCVNRMETPLDLLQRHNLLKFLANRRNLSPAEPEEEPMANPQNLREVLNENGNTMKAYRDKQKHRIHGRREDAATVKQHPGILKRTTEGADLTPVTIKPKSGVTSETEAEKTSSPDVVDALFSNSDQAATVIEATAIAAEDTPGVEFMTSDQATVIEATAAKERKTSAAEEAPLPLAEEKEGRKMSSTRSKKKQRTRTQRYTSNVFAMFNQGQIQEFKEAFNMIDQNRDGYVDKDDLFEMYTSLGKNPTEEELDVMINMAPGPINFTMFLTLFGEKLNGTDPEDVIKNAFACFDEKNAGFINEDYLRECLMTMGDRWSDDMVDELFHGAPIKEGRFDYQEFTRTLKHGAKEKDEEGDGEGQQGQGQQGQNQGQEPAPATSEAAAQ